MNERIKELLCNAMTEVGPDDTDLKTLEKFAELIVRECVKLAASACYGETYGVDARVYWNNGIAEAVDNIVEHFGVKND